MQRTNRLHERRALELERGAHRVEHVDALIFRNLGNCGDGCNANVTRNRKQSLEIGARSRQVHVLVHTRLQRRRRGVRERDERKEEGDD